ncbi:hypothetical protein B0H14DRAFT_2894565 [Mycena olivaceomarginata]|nr:hypothetical protein B0H14DRAFT_2894565 [Mycena olivaceomarginata]
MLRMKRHEWRLRSQLLAVRADILPSLPLLSLFVLCAATLPGFSDSTTVSSTRGRSRLRWSLSSQLNARPYFGPGPRLPMPAFTPSSESDHPGPEARLDVGALTVDHPEHPVVQRRDSTRAP